MVVGPSLDDAAVLQDQHQVGVRHRPQVMRDHQAGPPGHQPIERLAHSRLALHVEAGHRLVQHQHRGIADERPGDRDALALPARERSSPLADLGVVTVLHLANELVGVGGRGGGHDLLHARLGVAVGDVLPDGGSEQDRLLEDESDLAPQGLAAIATDVQAVDLDDSLP